jgi:hypothetical protein
MIRAVRMAGSVGEGVAPPVLRRRRSDAVADFDGGRSDALVRSGSIPSAPLSVTAAS